MINAIETLFGMAFAGIVGGIVFRLVRQPAASKRLFVIGIAALVLAVIGEIYVRM